MNTRMTYGLVAFGIVMVIIAATFFTSAVPLWVMIILGVAAMAALIIPVIYVKKPLASFDGKTLKVEGSCVDFQIDLDKIRSVELREKMSVGYAVNGCNNGIIASGTYCNDEFKDYIICADTDLHAFIVVHYSGKEVVFNIGDDEETTAFYDKVKTGIDGLGRRR